MAFLQGYGMGVWVDKWLGILLVVCGINTSRAQVVWDPAGVATTHQLWVLCCLSTNLAISSPIIKARWIKMLIFYQPSSSEPKVPRRGLRNAFVSFGDGDPTESNCWRPQLKATFLNLLTALSSISETEFR